MAFASKTRGMARAVGLGAGALAGPLVGRGAGVKADAVRVGAKPCGAVSPRLHAESSSVDRMSVVVNVEIFIVFIF